MTKAADDNIIVGLDIGTATVSALVGEGVVKVITLITAKGMASQSR